MRAENDIEDEEIEVHMAELSPRGFPITTGETQKIYITEIRKVATWKGGILGPVEYSYPNPKEWTLENIPGRKQLDQITVKDITLALKTHKEPGCKASWEKRLKLETEIPWREIGRNIAHGIGTKKDTGSWFKNILHRAMYLKGITTTTRTIRCTSCGRSHEDWNHFWKCPKYKPIWKKLINLMNETEIAEESGKTHDYTQEWVYLGIRKDGKALNRGHALMHMITWKYIIIAHTKASLEGIPPKNIKTDIIWKRIMSRLITRIHAIQHKTERARIKREAKQEGFSHYNTNKKIEPLAQMSETLDWHPKIEEELIRLNLVKPANQENT